MSERTVKRDIEALQDAGIDITRNPIDGRAAARLKDRGCGSVVITRRGKATKVMAVADRSGLPIAVGIESDQRNEQKLVGEAVERPALLALLDGRCATFHAMDRRLRLPRCDRRRSARLGRHPSRPTTKRAACYPDNYLVRTTAKGCEWTAWNDDGSMRAEGVFPLAHH